MAPEQDDGLAKLSEWNNTTDNYFRELQAKVHDRRQKLMEEKSINGELQEIACGLQGRASVHYERAEEQGVENFKEVMEQAEKELKTAKDELYELWTETFTVSQQMSADLDKYQRKFEDLVHQYKSAKSMDEQTALELTKCDEIQEETKKTEMDIAATDDACKELTDLSLDYGRVDAIMELYEFELEQVDDHINELNMKMQKWQLIQSIDGMMN